MTLSTRITTTAALAALLLATCEASAAFAFSREKSAVGVPLHPRSAIVLEVHALAPAEQKAVRRALATWLAATCASSSPSVELVEDTHAVHAGDATTIVVKRGAVSETFAAHTVTTEARDGAIESAVVTLDATRTFTTGDDVKADAFDLETVALHELGHALGLAHPIALNVPHDVVMRAGAKPGKKLRALSRDDVAGLCAIVSNVSK